MLIFAIDDEPKSLRLLHITIANVAPEAEIMDFPLGTAAVKAIETEGLKPDVIFSDIQMPELDGLTLAIRLKMLSPETKIVFVTGYSEYALDAIYLHASGYILKPLKEERVREELEHAATDIAPKMTTKGLYIQCFGQFEVYWQGVPLMFARKKTKELLAFLVDRDGAACNAEEIANALWEGKTDMSACKHLIRNLISDLKKTFAEIGMEEILVRRSGQVAIKREWVDCDYYRMLDGDMRAVNAFKGEYMSQYSWAEVKAGSLHFRFKKEG